MPFISIEFALFMLVFFPLYWMLKYSPRQQNILMLVCGLGWLYYLSPFFALSILAYTVVLYGIASGLWAAKTKAQQKIGLVIGIVAVLANLIFFKYYDFFRTMLPAELQGDLLDILMPLGLSYYSFQSIAYLVGLYREKQIEVSPQSSIHLSFLDLLLHLSFFPTITSGPIFRAYQVRHMGVPGASVQIKTREPRKIIQPALAISLILLGIMKKWWFSGVLAENWVNPIFENPMQYDGLTVLLGIYGYTAQLFFDFSGYTDMAIGIAMLLGFQLPPNFNMPMIAHNIREFWSRWHISLSTWIRDYIYIPLGGNKGSFIRVQCNLILAMVLSGVWHGYGWNFFVWGLVHGLGLVLLNIGDKLCGGRRDVLAQSPLGKIIGIVVTAHFVCFAFVVFRTQTLEEAQLIFEALWINMMDFKLPSMHALFSLGLVVLMWVFYPVFVKIFNGFVGLLNKLPSYLWFVPITIVLFAIMIFSPSGIPGFIYANF